MAAHPSPHLDLDEARRYLPRATDGSLEAFAARQHAARLRFATLLRFYRQHPSRMARIHLLTASAVTLGRFCGFSATFAAIGDALQPVDGAGAARTAAWADYVIACRAGRPFEVRDEAWIAAHVDDMEAVRRGGLDRAFDAEAEDRGDDPTFRLLVQHMAMTLGARLSDHGALGGEIPYETAIAQGIATALARIARGGSRLLARYARETARALLGREARVPPGTESYRRTAVTLLTTTLTAWTAAKVYRRGVRERTRGRLAPGETWPLLAAVLGERMSEVHPTVVRFYANPGRYAVRASLELHTLPARLWSLLLTLLVGQGLYESDPDPFDARFRVFRREDGSMHFVRELYPRGRLRRFDSDFVVREVAGRPAFFEVFADSRVDVEMELEPLAGGGLAIRGRHIYWRRIRLPDTGLKVEFRSRATRDEDGGELVAIDGRLLMRPESWLGRLVMCGILRRPERLGAIHYVAREVADAGPAGALSVPEPSQLRVGPGGGPPPSIR
jgi:hypothetical protein